MLAFHWPRILSTKRQLNAGGRCPLVPHYIPNVKVLLSNVVLFTQHRLRRPVFRPAHCESVAQLILSASAPHLKKASVSPLLFQQELLLANQH